MSVHPQISITLTSVLFPKFQSYHHMLQNIFLQFTVVMFYRILILWVNSVFSMLLSIF